MLINKLDYVPLPELRVRRKKKKKKKEKEKKRKNMEIETCPNPSFLIPKSARIIVVVLFLFPDVFKKFPQGLHELDPAPQNNNNNQTTNKTKQQTTTNRQPQVTHATLDCLKRDDSPHMPSSSFITVRSKHNLTCNC